MNYQKFDPKKKYDSKKTYTIRTDLGRIILGCKFKSGVFHTPYGGTVRNNFPFEVKEESKK